MRSALSEGSRKSYRRAWSVFSTFHERFYGVPTPELPLKADVLALFISYLSAKKLACSTITSYLSAIGYLHKLKGFTDPTKTFLIHKLLTALNRQRTFDVRLPITRPLLHELVRALGHTNSSAYQRKLYSAMFLSAFYGFFRVGELAARSLNVGISVVQYSSLSFLMSDGKPHSAKIVITDFKHNTQHRPFDVLIECEVSQPFCPVTTLLQYCQLRGSQAGPLFCHHDQRPVTVFEFTTELQRCLIFCGLDTGRYKSHSFRIGAACHAADNGLSDAHIRALGRWKSDAFKIYIRPQSVHANE